MVLNAKRKRVLGESGGQGLAALPTQCICPHLRPAPKPLGAVLQVYPEGHKEHRSGVFRTILVRLRCRLAPPRLQTSTRELTQVIADAVITNRV